MNDVATQARNDELTQIAAQCVMCGLCLPHCPSYRVEKNEADSPRGRLALMASIARNGAEAVGAASLDRCLACGACETVCPPKVQFVRAITLTRKNHIPTGESRIGFATRLLVRTPLLLAAMSRIAVRTRYWLPRSLRRQLNLDGIACTFREGRPMSTTPRLCTSGKAVTTLVAGCGARVIEHAATAAVEVIAGACGQALRVDRVHCCGALDAHLGIASHGTDGSSRDATATMVSINTGCAAQWRERADPGSTIGIATWLDTMLAERQLALAPQPLRVALHIPCSQQMLTEEVAAMRRLIGRVPGAELVALPANPHCCGAAGTYFLNQPAAAQTLSDEIARQIIALRPDLVVSANGGCRIQLAQALHELGCSIRVIHPAQLIAESICRP